MCAAPGSKTAQLIEMLHATENDSQPGCVNVSYVFITSMQPSLHYCSHLCHIARAGLWILRLVGL